MLVWVLKRDVDFMEAGDHVEIEEAQALALPLVPKVREQSFESSVVIQYLYSWCYTHDTTYVTLIVICTGVFALGTWSGPKESIQRKNSRHLPYAGERGTICLQGADR